MDQTSHHDRLTREHVPPALRDLRQWVLWRYEKRDGKPTKVPKKPNGRNAKANDPETWCDLDTALAALATDRFDGIGIMFGETVFGVDVDTPKDEHGRPIPEQYARDPETGDLSPEAAAIVAELDSYCEVSPSGTGVHVLLLADQLPGPERRRGNVEVYGPGSPRFFTFTGQHIDGTPADLVHRQEQLETVHACYVAKPTAPVATVTSSSPSTLAIPDAELLDRARRAANGDAFRALYDHGDLFSYNGDDSSADLALCSHLAFWCGPDRERIETLFSASALGQRDKWHDRSDYRERTIAKVLSTLTTWYQPGVGRVDPRTGEVLADGEPETVTSDDPNADHGTDLDLSARFVREHGADLRYVPERDAWLLWSGTHWGGDSALGVEQRAEATARGMWGSYVADAPDTRTRQARARAALRANGRFGQAAMVHLARHHLVLPASALDADPDALCVANGLLDLRTGQLTPHAREHFCSIIAPTPYDPDATCPTFLSFLEAAVPDEETRMYKQTLLGYGLTGHTRERVFSLLVGPTASGKSTFSDAITYTLGEHTRAVGAGALTEDGLPDVRVADAFDGPRLVWASESKRGAPWRVPLLKALTGGVDQVAARPLYAETRMFRPRCLILLASNHYPRGDGADGALWARLRVIPFPRTVPEDERDLSLPDRLRAEAPGILRWLVEGAMRWYREGLHTPMGVRDAGARYQLAEDVVGRFLGEHTILDPRGSVPARELYRAYHAWAAADGEEPLSETAFGRDLEERGFGKRKTKAENLRVGLRMAD